MQPAVGSYTARFSARVYAKNTAPSTAALTANTAYYPSDGKGGITTDEDLSFVRVAGVTLLTRAVMSVSVGSSTDYQIFHEDGTCAWSYRLNSTGALEWDLRFPDGGMRLTGNWYIQSNSTTPDMNVAFKIATGSAAR